VFLSETGTQHKVGQASRKRWQGKQRVNGNVLDSVKVFRKGCWDWANFLSDFLVCQNQDWGTGKAEQGEIVKVEVVDIGWRDID
jgi:hypothetical protein